MQRLDISQLIEQVIEICQPQLDVRRQTIALNLEASNREVVGDPSRLRQVFWNLVQNASKFSPPGEEIQLWSEEIDHTRIRVSVVDRGVGFSAEEAERTFTPFEGARRPAKRGAGLGLGLSICHGIIEGHGGSISGSSAGPGEGATFAVELEGRAIQSVGIEPAPAMRPAVHPFAGPGSLRILLVEDDPDSGDMLAALLSHLGHHVTLVSSVAQASMRAEDQWDAVISDIGLPDGSGLQIGRQFRDVSRGQVLLIAMSGYGTSSDISASREAGFDEHLVKPVDFSLIVAALQRPALR
jgi:CheY-like chemotaxis protein